MRQSHFLANGWLVFHFIWCSFGQLQSSNYSPPISSTISPSSPVEPLPRLPTPPPPPVKLAEVHPQVSFIRGFEYAAPTQLVRGSVQVGLPSMNDTKAIPLKNNSYPFLSGGRGVPLETGGLERPRRTGSLGVPLATGGVIGQIDGVAYFRAKESSTEMLHNATFAADMKPHKVIDGDAGASKPPLPTGFVRATGGKPLQFPPLSHGLVQGTDGHNLDPLIANETGIGLLPGIAFPVVTPPPRTGPEPSLNLTGVQGVKVVDPALTTNTSITTVSPGGSKPTVVPVIVAAAGIGLAVFGLTGGEMAAPAALAEAAEAVELGAEEAEEAGNEGEEEDGDKTKQTSVSEESVSQVSTSSLEISSSSFPSQPLSTTGAPSSTIDVSSSTASSAPSTTAESTTTSSTKSSGPSSSVTSTSSTEATTSTLSESSSTFSSSASTTSASSEMSSSSSSETLSTTSSTITTSSSSSASSTSDSCSIPTDLPQLGDPDDYDNSDEFLGAKIRRFTSGGLARRQGQGNSQPAGATSTKPALQFDTCKLTQNIQLPPYWRAGALMSWGKQGGLNGQYWYIPSPTSPNKAPMYTAVSDSALKKLTPRYAIGGTGGPRRVNVDHVYEVSILKNFFTRNLNKNNCQQFNKDFVVIKNGMSNPVLATIFKQLPGVEFGGLVGMDERLNTIKAYFFRTGSLRHGLKGNSACDRINNLISAGQVMDMLHSSELKGFFNDANSRIYKALIGADQLIAEGYCPPPKWSWAAEYKSYMTYYLRYQEREIAAWAADLKSQISREINSKSPTSFLDGPEEHPEKRRWDDFVNSPYGQASHWRFNFNPQYPSYPVAKRDDTTTCTKTSNSTFPAIAEPSVSPITIVGEQPQADVDPMPPSSAPIAVASQPEQPQADVDPVPPSSTPTVVASQAAPSFISSNGHGAPMSGNELNNIESANLLNNAIQGVQNPTSPSASPVTDSAGPQKSQSASARRNTVQRWT